MTDMLFIPASGSSPQGSPDISMCSKWHEHHRAVLGLLCFHLYAQGEPLPDFKRVVILYSAIQPGG